MIAVDADHQLVRLLRRLDHAEAVEPRGVEHDVAAALVEVVSHLDSLPLVIESAGVRDEDFGGWIRLLHPGAESGLELPDERELHATDESDLARGELSCQDAGEEGSLVLAEDDGPHVRGDGRFARRVQQGTVDEEESSVRVARGDRARCRFHHEADGDHQLGALIDEELQVGLVIFLRLAVKNQRFGDAEMWKGHPPQVRRQQDPVFGFAEPFVAVGGVAQAGSHDFEAPQRSIVEGLVASSTDVYREPDGVHSLLFPAAEKREQANAQGDPLHSRAL